MKVLVTGGLGFLGTGVVRRLRAAGHEVLDADVRPGAAVPLDVTDRAGVDAAFAAHSPEVVVHLASVVTPGRDSDRAREYAVDVDGSRNVVDACLAHGVRRIVVSSSGAAYGYHADNPVPLREDDPPRGNPEFAYSHHKRLVEELLAAARDAHPELEQVVLRIGTILGERVDNQITALFERPRLLAIRGADSPFVFVWDDDVAAIVERAVTGPVTGVVNVAGDGALTVAEIAARLGKPVLAVPEPVLRAVLTVARRLRLTRYGPEQTRFLRYRPVLANDRLTDEFGYRPGYTSGQAFDAWVAARLRSGAPVTARRSRLRTCPTSRR
ncbi:NAD-dependent epimerase/dehydratase family protein [Pseudonocardia sp. NPDC046786]|uniref:NAD-dependent epimerase/dehydratase family protein n=1 Tax=Pseudonocardia sp. NPDC046786 TaxID=3155471 RepID=UPI0034066681